MAQRKKRQPWLPTLETGGFVTANKGKELRFWADSIGANVHDDDFTHDARLSISGDFGSSEERIAYANKIADLLNRPEASIEQEQPVAQRWIPVDEKMPKPGAYVLAYFKNSYGKDRRIRACHYPKHTQEDNGNFQGDADYDEAKDCYYWPEGWYETNEYEETSWMVSDDVTHWMPLPEPPLATGTASNNAQGQIIPDVAVESIEQDAQSHDDYLADYGRVGEPGKADI